jgi:hypothetical protein
MTRQQSADVRGWPCTHVDTLDGPVHVYAYTAPSGLVRYTFQRPQCPESVYAYPSLESVTTAATFWSLRW